MLFVSTLSNAKFREVAYWPCQQGFVPLYDDRPVDEFRVSLRQLAVDGDPEPMRHYPQSLAGHWCRIGAVFVVGNRHADNCPWRSDLTWEV